MRKRSVPVLFVGLLLLGLLIIRCTPQPVTPAIGFLQPDPSIPIVTADDPATLESPMVVDVEVKFPPSIDPCAGSISYPVIPGTLQVTLQQVDDLALIQEWDVTDSMVWNQTNDAISGQVTIGGVGSGQSWAAYRVRVFIRNSQGAGARTVDIRVEKPVTELMGGHFDVDVTSITQRPPYCILPNAALSVVLGIIEPFMPMQIYVPGGAEYPSSILLPLPDPIGELDVDADLDEPGNDVVFEPVSMAGIDLGPYDIPGFNCLVGGTADGAFNGQVDPDDIDGVARVFEMEVGLGTGTGDCLLATPDPDCQLFIALDGDRSVTP
jgi:hypothetical protein